MLNAVAAVPLDAVSFENVVAPLAGLDLITEPTVTNVTLFKDLAVEKELRDEAVSSQTAMSENDVKASMRVDVY